MGPTMMAQAGGTILSVMGALTTGESQSDMYKYQAGVARVNKQIALQNADYALRTGAVQAQESGMGTRYKLGQIKTAQAASGLDVTKGSAALVRDSQQDIGQYEQQMIHSNAARRAYGEQIKATGFEAEARGDEIAASNARTAGYINAFSSILGGAGSVASKWQTAKMYGMDLS